MPVDLADDEGLVGIGGDLKPGTLLAAYADGVFPWYCEGDPILWWSPNPRAIMEFENFHISRSLAKTLKKGRFSISFDSAFPEVMQGCGENRPDGTWINSEMLAAYATMHKRAYAHSAEVWLEGRLVGGVYGVGIGGFFSAESMFHRETDASKVALAALVGRLRDRGYSLIDLQLINDHTRSLGASEISRVAYLERLRLAIRQNVSFS